MRTPYRRVLFLIGLMTLGLETAIPQTASGTGGGTGITGVTPFFEEPDWQAVCSRAVATTLPSDAAKLANSAAAEPNAPAKKCDEQALYYGFGTQPDYGAALQCAYWHRSHPGAASNFLEGAGTLAMLYANGDGVPRNYGLAIRFACEAATMGGQNTEERIGVLEALRDGKMPPGTRFDLCDEQMSGAMGAYCAEITEKQADAKRSVRIAAIRERLSPQARAMLPNLQAAETRFEEARSQGEYSGGGGSGAAGFVLGDQNLLQEQFVINLERFASGRVPKASSSDRLQAQRQLEAAYAAALAVPRDGRAFTGGPTVPGLKATQTAWQVLFDEWMKFVPVAFPNLGQDQVATELLRLRIHQLRKVTY